MTDLAYEHALDLAMNGRIVACIPTQTEDGQPAIEVPEFEPSEWGWIAATHPDKRTRELFLAGVIVGLHRYCKRDIDDGSPMMLPYCVDDDA